MTLVLMDKRLGNYLYAKGFLEPESIKWRKEFLNNWNKSQPQQYTFNKESICF